MSEYIHKNKLIKIIDDAYSKHGDVLGISNYIKNAINNMPSIEAEEPLPDIDKCPICGYSAKMSVSYDSYGQCHKADIKCNNCGITLSFNGAYNDTRRDVEERMIEKWNDLKERQSF